MSNNLTDGTFLRTTITELRSNAIEARKAPRNQGDGTISIDGNALEMILLRGANDMSIMLDELIMCNERIRKLEEQIKPPTSDGASEL